MQVLYELHEQARWSSSNIIYLSEDGERREYISPKSVNPGVQISINI